MKNLARISILLLLVMSMSIPFVHATSIVNVADMDTPVVLLIFSPPNDRYFSQSFTTLGDGLNLTTIVLPLTAYNNSAGSCVIPGAITAEIHATTAYGLIDTSGFPIVSGTSLGYGVPYSNSSTDIFWLQIAITPTQLLPATTYALVVHETWTAGNVTGFYWWANGRYGLAAEYAYMYLPGGAEEPMPYWDAGATGNEFAFGFELIEGISTFTGVLADAYLFLSLFLTLALGVVGFGMSRGKEPLAAIFLMMFGVLISYMMGWLPAWILASSFAVLGIVLAYKFRGALHG